MEQTVNQFNKGLLIDTHPMVLGNDTLSDALNATFVTMNGNEVVLQNDMGNRRIDNAYLPAGYEPVGIKEYGGVIYVAAYNPITGRGLIGSFPSPQRKLSIGNNVGEDLNLDQFIEQISGNLYLVILKNITIPISDDVVLHTGDKFSVYSLNITTLLPYLTKPGDTKNNLFTFQIGLFNSLNEFVDISDKLKLHNFGTDINPIQYYIWDNSGVVDTSLYTISDVEFEKSRNSLAINTYSYKMASPLYLRAILNTPTNITYTIDGEKSGNNLTLFLDVTYTYNCLDEIDNNHFAILFNNTLYNPQGTFTSIPNEELNNYSVTLSYVINELTDGTNILPYTIQFLLLNNYSSWSGRSIILPEFTINSSINILNLNSDKVELNGYRYYIDTNNKKITLDIDISSYPKKTSNYNIYPIIYVDGENDPYELTTYTLSTNNSSPKTGIYLLEFDYDTVIPAIQGGTSKGFTFEYRKKYEIRFKLSGTGITNNIVNTQGTVASGLFIITPIFNGNYIGTSPNSNETLTNDGGYNYNVSKNDYIKDFSSIKYLILSPILSTTLSQLIYNRNVEKIGLYVYELDESGDKKYNVKETYTCNTNINVDVTLENSELYPQEILSSLQLSNSNLSGLSLNINGEEINSDNQNYEYSNNLTELRGDYLELNPGPVIEIKYSNSSTGNTILIQSDVTINNYVKGGLIENNNIICNKVITCLYDFVKNRYFTSGDNQTYDIRSPYVCLDWEGENTLSLLLDLGTFKDNTLEDNGINLILTTPTKSSLKEINEILKSGSENFLLLDYNSDDTVVGDGPGFIFNANNLHTRGVRKIWMKISEKEYTPLVVELWSPVSNLIQEIFKDNNSNKGYNIDGNNVAPTLNIMKIIPHYYAYSLDSITLDKNVINYLLLIKTKEFDIPSTLELVLNGTVTLSSNNSYYQLESSPYTAVKELEISEPNLKSNEDINNYLERIENLNFDCVLSRPTLPAHLGFNSSDRVIEYEDREGNTFDPLYVYYLFDETNINSGFLKSYKAKTFYVSDLFLNMPELKSSDLLYHSSDGRLHPYINSDVISSKERLELTVRNRIGWLTNEQVLYSRVEDLANGNYLDNISQNTLSGTVSVDYPPFLVNDDPYHPGLYYWNRDFTYALYEAGGGMFIWTPLTCKNIFNLRTIRNFKLYKGIDRNSSCPIDDGWISADECYNNS